MKFWQVISVFRDEPGILANTLTGELLEQFQNIGNIIRAQERVVLDAEIDSEFLKQICTKSKKKIFLSKDSNKIFSYRTNNKDIEIPLLDAITLFKHDAIEEVFEKTEAVVE